MSKSFFEASRCSTAILIGFLLFGLSACGGSSSKSDDPEADPAADSKIVDLNFGAQAQNVALSAGVPQDFTTSKTFDVTVSGGPFQSITVDASAALSNISSVVLRPGAARIAQKTETVYPDSPVVGNCFPFGMGPLGNPGTTGPWGPYGGFVYQNLPPFDLQAGDTLAFDLGQVNDVDIGLDIDMAPTTVNGGSVPATAFVRIASNTQTPNNPRGDTVMGNFELGFTVENAFNFAGGGLIIRFSNPSATYNADSSCDQVLVYGDPGDTSGFFVERFFTDADGTSPWDTEFLDTIGVFRVGSGVLTTAATVEVYHGLSEERDNLCGVSPHVQLLTLYLNSLNQLDSVQPAQYSASQAVIDMYNSGSIATCTRVTPQVNATASMSGLQANTEKCTAPPSDLSGIWSGNYVCTGSCPETGMVTLTVTQNGSEASYSDGSASYSGHVCGDVFSFQGGSTTYDESGKLTLTAPNSATKTSFFRSSPSCSASCTDTLTRP